MRRYTNLYSDSGIAIKAMWQKFYLAFKSVKAMQFFRSNYLFLRLVFFSNPANGSRHYICWLARLVGC